MVILYAPFVYAAPFSTFVGGTGAAGTLTGMLKGNGTSPFTVAANGTDFTLITALDCTGSGHLLKVSAAGVFTCSADSGGAGGGAWPFVPGLFGPIPTQSTSTVIQDSAGLIASSTSWFDQINVGSTTVGGMSTSTFFGNVNINGAINIASATASSTPSNANIICDSNNVGMLCDIGQLFAADRIVGIGI